MTERFKRYLEEKFRQIPPTRAAMEFRKQTLQQLEEYAQDCRIKGMDNEDAIYKVAVASLGDFDKTLTDFQNALTEKPKRLNRGFIVATAITLAVALTLAVFIGLSITGVVAWRVSWLIPVGVIFAGAVALLATTFAKSVKRGRTLVPRLTGSLAICLLMTYAYLVAHLCFGKPLFDWLTFLLIPVSVAWLNVAVAYIVKNKSAVLETVFSAYLTSVMLYVILGIVRIMPWHPGWLLPVIAALLAVTVIVVYLAALRRERHKLLLKKNSDDNDVNEKYYTEW